MGRPLVAADRRAAGPAVGPVGRGALVVVANAKNSMGAGQGKGGTNRHRKRTSGYRVRKQTVGGRRVLKARRKRGRKVLAPASTHGSKFSGGKKDRPKFGR